MSQDERVLAMRRKLEEKEQEYQRMKHKERSRVETPKPAVNTSRYTEMHNKVSMKSKKMFHHSRQNMNPQLFLYFTLCLKVKCLEEMEQSLESFIERNYPPKKPLNI